jgi:hypothetical protein
MIDPQTLAKARNEVARLNRELAELHLEEERCRLRRGRLEGEKTRVQTLVDMAELAQRLAEKPDHASPAFHIETAVSGAKVVVVDKLSAPPSPEAGQPRRKLKPEGLPPVSVMVVTALRETGKASRPVEIADFVRRRWWSTAPTEIINTTVWHMAKAGKLIGRDGYYGLNGVGH